MELRRLENSRRVPNGPRGAGGCRRPRTGRGSTPTTGGPGLPSPQRRCQTPTTSKTGWKPARRRVRDCRPVPTSCGCWASVLVAANQHDKAIELLDERMDGAESPAEVACGQGGCDLFARVPSTRARSRTSGGRAHPLRTARAQDPLNVNAHYRAGAVLSSIRRTDEAVPLLAEAVRLSPSAIRIRTGHWRSIIGSREIEPEEKRRLVAAVRRRARQRFFDFRKTVRGSTTKPVQSTI